MRRVQVPSRRVVEPAEDGTAGQQDVRWLGAISALKVA